MPIVTQPAEKEKAPVPVVTQPADREEAVVTQPADKEEVVAMTTAVVSRRFQLVSLYILRTHPHFTACFPHL